MDKRKIKNAMALIGLMGILLYGACGNEKRKYRNRFILVSHVMTREIPSWGNFWKILKGNAGHWKKGI